MNPRSALNQLLSLAFIALLTGCAQLESSSLAAEASAQSGRYPNLFAEAGYAPNEIARKIDTAFQQLFHGDPSEQAVYYPAGSNEQGPLAYILDVNNGDVRSEGMSYGMMIAVQLNKKAQFDAIWNWAKTHMYHTRTDHPARGYFAWSVKSSGEPIDEMPAPDGEEYFATALYFAAARWEGGVGIYDYRAQADRLLTDALHRERITGMTNRGEMTAVNLFDTTAKMVRFTPDVTHAGHTDASYHVPAFYEVWSRVGPAADRSFWREVAKVSREYFYRAAHPRTGLTPDYGNFDGTPWAAPWRKDSADFRYDAWRSTMNWSVDWSWWRKDPRQVELSNRLQTFFLRQGLEEYASLYSLDGRTLGGTQATGLVAMNATASLAADHSRRYDFVKALWERPIPSGHDRYYDGMLYMMALLHCSGEFKAWMPDD
jgi:oligosaccharide reducing-end xylanase